MLGSWFKKSSLIDLNRVGILINICWKDKYLLINRSNKLKKYTLSNIHRFVSHTSSVTDLDVEVLSASGHFQVIFFPVLKKSPRKMLISSAYISYYSPRSHYMCVKVSLYSTPVINHGKCPWIKIPNSWPLPQRASILPQLPRPENNQWIILFCPHHMN